MTGKPSASDVFLRELIQKGDMIECASGIYEANAPVGERYNTAYYHAIVPLYIPPFIIPVECYCILAVYRNGVCLYKRGETVVQKSLWGD